MTQDRIEHRCEGVFTPSGLGKQLHCSEPKGHDGSCHWNYDAESTWGFGGVRVAMTFGPITRAGFVDLDPAT